MRVRRPNVTALDAVAIKSFNGAALMRVRRHFYRGRSVVPEQLLQRGRTHESAETFAVRFRFSAPRSASTGPHS